MTVYINIQCVKQCSFTGNNNVESAKMCLSTQKISPVQEWTIFIDEQHKSLPKKLSVPSNTHLSVPRD